MKFDTYTACLAASAVVLLTLLVAGCGRRTADGESSGPAQATVDVDAAKYLLEEEPDGAVGVISAREEAQDGEAIVLIGRIGGSKQPWIDGRSAFMLIDASMTVVADGEDSAGGEICLDDCCASLLKDCTTLVKLVDAQGGVLPVDARQLLGAETDDLVVVRGRVERDEEEGVFVVISDGVHVRR